MEEKQEFQLGDVFYVVSKNYAEGWISCRDIVRGIKQRCGKVYIEGKNTNFVEQSLCGHSLKEAQEIAVRNFYLDIKGQIKVIRGLKEV